MYGCTPSSRGRVDRRVLQRLSALAFVFTACFTTDAIAQEPTALNATTAAPAASTQTPASADEGFLDFFRRTEVSGFVDVYYSYNFNQPSSGDAALRNFDVRHNSFTLSLAELSLNKAPTADSRVGFRIDLDYGSTQTFVNAAEPGGADFKNIDQAYLSYLAPGKGLQIDVGKFTTPVGNEVIKTKDNWNYSRSLLFTLAEPYYHMGVRAAYPISDKVSVSGFLVNGWNDVVDNNTGKTVGAQVALKPLPALTITQTYLGGPEQTDNNDDWRHLLDTVVAYTVNPRVSLAANYDYGHDKVDGQDVSWQGVAVYARAQVNPLFAVVPRFEYYDDGDGFTTSVSQKVKEVTLTGELKPAPGFLVRLEYRRDWSGVDVFPDKTDFSDAQNTFTVGLVYAFSTKQ